MDLIGGRGQSDLLLERSQQVERAGARESRQLAQRDGLSKMFLYIVARMLHGFSHDADTEARLDEMAASQKRGEQARDSAFLRERSFARRQEFVRLAQHKTDIRSMRHRIPEPNARSRITVELFAREVRHDGGGDIKDNVAEGIVVDARIGVRLAWFNEDKASLANDAVAAPDGELLGANGHSTDHELVVQMAGKSPQAIAGCRKLEPRYV